MKIPYGLTVSGLRINKRTKGYVAVALCSQFKHDKTLEKVHAKIKGFLDEGRLNRIKLQDWLEDVINKVLAQYGNIVGDFKISYGKRATAHNIYVVETKNPRKKISIDFVCGLQLQNKTEYVPGKMSVTSVYDHYSWYLVPKASKYTEFSFMLASPELEHELLWNRQNLKNACRLLKAMRDHYELDAIKSYFVITCFLFEVEKRPTIYWSSPLEVILINVSLLHTGFLSVLIINSYFLDLKTADRISQQ